MQIQRIFSGTFVSFLQGGGAAPLRDLDWAGCVFPSGSKMSWDKTHSLMVVSSASGLIHLLSLVFST